MKMNNFDTREYNALALLANICQIANFDMSTKEITNDAIMRELQEQDKILSEQTNLYLKRIIEQNELIISLLKELKSEK